LTPEFDSVHNLPLDIAPATVAAALRARPAARAVVLVSPSYVGVTSDLCAIAELCHAAGVPLLVDEAWGPHFHFHPDLPRSAMQSGADAGVCRAHKLLAALTQGSTLVARQGLLDLERLSAMVELTQTTSPSAQIFAALDASRRQMALHGKALLSNTLTCADELRRGLSALAGLRVLDPSLVAQRPGVQLDPTRVMVDVHELGLTGYEAEQLLRDEHGVYVEMSDLLSVLLLVTIGDDATSIERALTGFRALASRRRPARHTVAVRSSGELLFGGEPALTPRAAFMARAEAVPLAQASGRVSAESVTPYPPGIPLVAPGEVVSPQVIDYLRVGVAEGMYITGPADPTCATLRVVA
jgi:arginine/lysine/ornithine decarboxylase